MANTNNRVKEILEQRQKRRLPPERSVPEHLLDEIIKKIREQGKKKLKSADSSPDSGVARLERKFTIRDIFAHKRVVDDFGKKILGAAILSVYGRKYYHQFKKPYPVPPEEAQGVPEDILKQGAVLYDVPVEEIVWSHRIFDSDRKAVVGFVFFTMRRKQYWCPLDVPVSMEFVRKRWPVADNQDR